ncbi:uncharacterized protein LOC117296843 [Asterias rubens]|uniref:uncharacterized protein LOC117296843 n=1 Tax=Asterias rubens TaxID=7604 RepID=UPI0014558B66|nr:uncharacterized protein LOC117296843 [Asterias rubens]
MTPTTTLQVQPVKRRIDAGAKQHFLDRCKNTPTDNSVEMMTLKLKDCVKSTQKTFLYKINLSSDVVMLRLSNTFWTRAKIPTADNMIDLMTLEMTLRLFNTFWTECTSRRSTVPV